jgi:signal transduction histidine kinase
LMNIFSKYIKHTDNGFIHVKLSPSLLNSIKQDHLSEEKLSKRRGLKEAISCVFLTVKDTGRGISQEYLQNYLYTPFSQEDPLSPRTDLGLSIVRHRVRPLGGVIDIQSIEGVGC